MKNTTQNARTDCIERDRLWEVDGREDDPELTWSKTRIQTPLSRFPFGQYWLELFQEQIFKILYRKSIWSHIATCNRTRQNRLILLEMEIDFFL